MRPNERDGMFLILLSVTGYALLPVFARTVQTAGLNSLDIATWRFGLAVPLFWLLVAVLRQARSSKPLPRKRLVAMGGIFAVAAVTAFWGFERIPAGTYVVLFYTYPAMVAVLSALMGERLSGAAWAALILTMVGVFLTAPDFSAGLSGDHFEGVLLALFNAFIVAVYFILSGRLLKGQTALAEGSALSVSGALMLLLLIIPLRTMQSEAGFSVEGVVRTLFAMPILALESTDGLAIVLNMLGMAAISTVMPVFCLTAGIQKVGATRASIMGAVEPILTSTFAFVFLGQRMEPIALVGGGLIVLSVVILQLGSRAPAGKPEYLSAS